MGNVCRYDNVMAFGLWNSVYGCAPIEPITFINKKNILFEPCRFLYTILLEGNRFLYLRTHNSMMMLIQKQTREFPKCPLLCLRFRGLPPRGLFTQHGGFLRRLMMLLLISGSNKRMIQRFVWFYSFSGIKSQHSRDKIHK
jgi:hypothetical protein